MAFPKAENRPRIRGVRDQDRGPHPFLRRSSIMADRLRENELYGHGRRGRIFRGEREEESGYAYGRGFGEPGETYERAFEGPGYAYGRGYGGQDAAPGDYYSIYQGRAFCAR